ncbi:MAG: DEAD/DEAH box helicase, partial [Ilumatobacteraceae bacterium]
MTLPPHGEKEASSVGFRSAPLAASTKEFPFMSPTFADLGVPEAVVNVLQKIGITDPFPIQRSTLPDSLDGRDILGRGRTGSGKTLAFALPVVVRLASRQQRPSRGAPRALVLVPTRELAHQVAATFEPIGRALRISHTVIHGGVGQGPQVNALQRGVDVVIACPGRLEDLIEQRVCSLGSIEVTVIDEADHMADLGFLPAVKRLLDRIPSKGQKMLFSATLDNGVNVLIDRYLHDPVSHSVDSAESPVPKMDHHVFRVSRDDKPTIVKALASGPDRTLLFTRTKHMAKRLAQQLSTAGIPAVDLHGNLSQSVRTKNLEAFSSGEVTVMVATDIAARGIHVDGVELVVHVDPPAEHKAFLHRSGRTARAGSDGTVVTLVMPEQRKDVDDLVRKAGIRPTFTNVEPGHSLIENLAGAPVAKRFVKRPTPQPTAPRRPTNHSRGSQQSSRRNNASAPSGRPGRSTSSKSKP